jgi:anti-sigma regulatory factor (Ser/Thr protein kinase)
MLINRAGATINATISRAELRTALHPHGGEVGRARSMLAESMRHWGMPDEDRGAALLLSELVTNALLHGRPPLELVARDEGGRLRVEVYDGAPDAVPVLRWVREDAVNGRGLQLVDRLASRWGWGESVDGKYVWFELDGSA